FHRVVEEAVHAVAVVLIILRGVDAALRGDRVRAPRTVLNAEVEDVVAQLAERRGRRRARQSGTDHDDRVLALVRRVDQLHLELVPVPLAIDRACRNPSIERHTRTRPPCVTYAHAAMTMNRPAMRTASSFPAASSVGVIFG